MFWTSNQESFVMRGGCVCFVSSVSHFQSVPSFRPFVSGGGLT
jgi:hypothetical protein